jgi:hypothetical protein
MIIEGRFQVFQRFSSSNLVLKTIESCFMALNYYGNGSMIHRQELGLRRLTIQHKLVGSAQKCCVFIEKSKSDDWAKKPFKSGFEFFYENSKSDV